MTTPETPPPDSSPDRITPPKSLEPDQIIRPPQSGTGFESYMKGTAPGAAAPPGGPTPMEVSRPPPLQASGTPTMNTLVAQAQTVQDTLGTVQGQLRTPNLKFKRSQAHLLRNKLTDAQSHSRAIAAKLGVETPEMKPPEGGGALERFLSYVNDGQEQFNAVQNKLNEMAASNQQLNAADMMLLQAKMNTAQQEIEFSSVLLSKVISSITTIMGIQL